MKINIINKAFSLHLNLVKGFPNIKLWDSSTLPLKPMGKKGFSKSETEGTSGPQNRLRPNKKNFEQKEEEHGLNS